jgi:hypothetical protein
MRAHVVLAALGLVQVGCYNYTPLRRSHIAPSTYLAVTLTEAGTEELAPYIGPNVLIVRGRLLSTTDRGFVLSVAGVESRRGDILEWKGESVAIPGEFVRSLEQRHSAAGKTVLLAGASLAGFFAAYAAFGPGASGETAGGVGVGPSPR